MPAPNVNVDLTAHLAAVTRATSLAAGAIGLIQSIGPLITAAVTEALSADDAADQGSVDAAVAAIQTTINDHTSALQASSDQLEAAITANTPPAAPNP